MSDTGYYGDYALAEASALRKRKQQSIANQQAAFLGQQRGSRNIAELQKSYSQNLNPFMAQYGRRGLVGGGVQSGITTQGLSKYAETLQKNIGNESQNLQTELQRIQDLETSQQSDLNDYLAQLRYDKAKAIFDSASAIKNVSTY